MHIDSLQSYGFKKVVASLAGRGFGALWNNGP